MPTNINKLQKEDNDKNSFPEHCHWKKTKQQTNNSILSVIKIRQAVKWIYLHCYSFSRPAQPISLKQRREWRNPHPIHL